MRIYQSQGAMFQNALVLTAAPALCIYALQSPGASDTLSKIILLAAAIGSGGLVLYFLIQSFRKNKLVIQLDEEGFHQFGTSIPWSGIASFHQYNEIAKHGTNVMIGLDLTESARTLLGLPTPTARAEAEMPGDIVVCHDITGISVPDMLALLENYRIYYTQNPVDQVSIVAQQPEEVVQVRNSGAGN